MIPRALTPPSRRSVLRAAAWTTPVVLAASAAPAFASSTASPWVMLSSPDAPLTFHDGHSVNYTILVTNTTSTPVPGPITLSVPRPEDSHLEDFSTEDPDWIIDKSSDPPIAQTENDLPPGASVSFALWWTARGRPVTFSATVTGGDPSAVHTFSFDTWGESAQ